MSKNLQETFNEVMRHAYTQRCKSLSENGTPYYHGRNGNKCFVGIRIPLDAYNENTMEGFAFCRLTIDSTINQNFRVAGSGFGVVYPFWTDLQFMHDNFEPEQWPAQFDKFATVHHLKIEVTPFNFTEIPKQVTA